MLRVWRDDRGGQSTPGASLKKEISNCRTCGACCVAPYEATEFVDLLPKDFEQLSKGYQRRVNEQGAFGALDLVSVCLPVVVTVDETRCLALRGTVMGRVCCAIYERRPYVCRIFKPDSRDCFAVRRSMENNVVRARR